MASLAKYALEPVVLQLVIGSMFKRVRERERKKGVLLKDNIRRRTTKK